MRILFFGDIVAKPGRKTIAGVLPSLKKELKPDFIIGNVENLAHGTGITPRTIGELDELGFDAYTSGNHIYKKEPGFPLIESKDVPVLRPANFEGAGEGIGSGVWELPFQSRKLLIVNLMGTVFMKEEGTNPFHALENILEDYKDERLAGIFVDFHAEATSEKYAMGLYFDGKVSAVVGTHTHVQTNDARIFEEGTGFVADAGMCGITDSLIGVSKSVIKNNFVDEEDFSYEAAEDGLHEASYVVIDIDPETQKCTGITVDKKSL